MASWLLAVGLVLLGARGALRAQGNHVGDAPRPSSAEMQAFWSWWGDGKGEVSSYRITQNRYGEVRTGEAALVFVTEELSRTTLLKNESGKVPPADRMPVLKYNRNEKFATGIYDYAYLTSTYSALASEQGQHAQQAMKIAMAMEEWCGPVFMMLRTHPDHLDATRHSYFEDEGDSDGVRVALPSQSWECEDNLPILIRELAGEWMREGETRSIKLMPSMQHLRFAHSPMAFVDATITKDDGGSVAALGRPTPVVKWTWSYHDGAHRAPDSWKTGEVRETWYVERAAPHRIIKWECADGSGGSLLTSKRLPYWELHAEKDAGLRREFKLSSPGK